MQWISVGWRSKPYKGVNCQGKGSRREARGWQGARGRREPSVCCGPRTSKRAGGLSPAHACEKHGRRVHHGSASPGRAGPAPGGRSTRPGRPPVPVDVPLKTIFIAVLEEHQKQNKTIFGLYAAPCGVVGKAGSSPRPWLLARGDWRFRMGLGFPLGGGLARGGGRDGVGLGRPAGRQGAGGRAERRGAGVCAPGEQRPHAGNQLGTEQALDQCCLLSGGPGGRGPASLFMGPSNPSASRIRRLKPRAYRAHAPRRPEL